MTVQAFATEVNLLITVIERYKWTLTSSLNGTIPPFGFPGVFAVLGTGGGGISPSLNIAILNPLYWYLREGWDRWGSIFISEDGYF